MRLLGRGSFLPHNGKDMELYGAVPHVLIDIRPAISPLAMTPQLESNRSPPTRGQRKRQRSSGPYLSFKR